MKLRRLRRRAAPRTDRDTNIAAAGRVNNRRAVGRARRRRVNRERRPVDVREPTVPIVSLRTGVCFDRWDTLGPELDDGRRVGREHHRRHMRHKQRGKK